MQMFRYATMLSWIQHAGRRVDGWQLALSAVSKLKVQTLATLRKGIKACGSWYRFRGYIDSGPRRREGGKHARK